MHLRNPEGIHLRNWRKPFYKVTMSVWSTAVGQTMQVAMVRYTSLRRLQPMLHEQTTLQPTLATACRLTTWYTHMPAHANNQFQPWPVSG